MTRDEVYDAWAPANDRWRPWAKPVLFANLNEQVLAERPFELPAAADGAWLRRDLVGALAPDDVAHPYRGEQVARDVAIVVELPGVASVYAGLGLALIGFRPVPLYNAIPSNTGVIDLRAVSNALIDGAARVAAVPPGAPPVFLLDADRMGDGRNLRSGDFDNRSMCRAGDFPSADFLWEAGIRRAVLVRAGDKTAGDLAPILFAWQQRGIEWWLERSDVEGAAQRHVLARPSWLSRLGNGFLHSLLYRRADGAYGHLVDGPQGG